MRTPESPLIHETDQIRLGDIAFVGEELADDELVFAVGGLQRRDVEVVSYDENDNVTDHEINIFYV